MIKSIDKKVFLYIVVAFLFSIGVRMIWVYEFSSFEDFFWNGELMINTNDGYYYAEGARDILDGAHQENDFSPIDSALSLLTAFFAKILPFSFESIILYMPSVLSSLLVIPVFMLGRVIKDNKTGFIAALLASIAWSYYNRTMTGYYDTDMLNVVFPTLILFFIVTFIENKNPYIALSASITTLVYTWWYSASYPLILAFVGVIFFYALFAYYQKKEYLHVYKFLILFLIASAYLDIFYRLLLIAGFFMLFTKKDLDKKLIFILFFITLGLVLMHGGANQVFGKLENYIFRHRLAESIEDIKLFFFTTNQTVSEASSIPFDIFANRISGNVLSFFVSIVGYIYLCLKRPIMLLSLPMVGLGFLAYNGGLRFTIYAIPLMALGFAFLLVKIGEYIKNKPLQYVFLSFFTILVLIPNILHIIDYKVPTVFNRHEVKIIQDLKNEASREDYALSWWDYGYPLRYYADVKTLVDGGASKDLDNLFLASFALNFNQVQSSNIARLAIEYREKSFEVSKKNKKLNKDDKNYTKMPSTLLAQMMKDYGFKDSNLFLDSLSDDIKLPKKTREIFLYLPFRMLSIMPTIAKFSYRDLMNGEDKKSPFFYQSNSFKDIGEKILLDNGMAIDKKSSVIIVSSNQIPIKSFYTIDYKKDYTPLVRKQTIREDGLHVIFAKAYNSFFLLDDDAFNSTFIQLFFLGSYDKNRFELVKANPYAKIYRLKK